MVESSRTQQKLARALLQFTGFPWQPLAAVTADGAVIEMIVEPRTYRCA